MTIKFMHIRACEADFEPGHEGNLDRIIYHLLQTGGMTIAYTENETVGGIFFHVAFCHPKDHFSRKIGRELAAHRLRTEGPYDTLEFKHPIAATIRQWISHYFGFEIIEGDKGVWMSTMEEAPEVVSTQ